MERVQIKYVVADIFNAELFTVAQHAQVAREGGDYQAVTPSEEEAKHYTDGAAKFLTTIEAMLSPSSDLSPKDSNSNEAQQ